MPKSFNALRWVFAVLVAPVAVPFCYGLSMWLYAGGNPYKAEPLLPGHLAAVWMLAFEVTLLIGLPTWWILTGKRHLSWRSCAVIGGALGLSVAVAFRYASSQLGFAPGFLELVGGTGGALCAGFFCAVAGQRRPYIADQSQTGSWWW